MTEQRFCPGCGDSMPAGIHGGLCSKCVLAAGYPGESDDMRAGRLKRAGSPGPKGSIDFDQFRRATLELGLMDAEEWELYAAFGELRDVARLSRALVHSGKMTQYQVAAICQGKAKGLLIGEYVVLDKLGQGGMGVVFKAKRRSAGKPIALKILPPSFGRDQDAVRRFRREFEIASRIDHPNIVSVLDTDEDRGVQFLTMVYIEGQDLNKLVGDLGPLPIELGLDCAIQAACGLAAAHERGIVHRDVKPGNLILDGSGRVRVLDLGLARVIEAASHLGRAAGESLTQTGTYLGTVDFLAPEQADDSKRADHRADIYSLGCTIYYLLTGKPPFGGDSVLKRLMAHQTIPAPSLRGGRADVPVVLDELCQEMMAKKPENRPESMAEVFELLEACRKSPAEAEAARSNLRGFAETIMKRASPRRRGLDGEGSIFARRDEPQGLQFDPDLRLEDLVMDFRDVVRVEPLKEEQLPPRPPRIIQPARSSQSRRTAPIVFLGIAAFLLGSAAFMMFPRTRSGPESELIPIALPVSPEIPIGPAPELLGAFELIDGRPTLVAPYRARSFTADGVIEPGEYGPPVAVDFTAGSQFGAVALSKEPFRTPEDLSVRIYSAYSESSLFLAFRVRDQSVDDKVANRNAVFLSDCVELFLDGDRVANDFEPLRKPTPGSSPEGFQLLVNSVGHRLTVAEGLTYRDWKASTKRIEDGYVVEFEIPLAIIDVRDGPERVSAGPGSVIHFVAAIDDYDRDSRGDERAFAYLRARQNVGLPFEGGEKSWSMGIHLAPKGQTAESSKTAIVEARPRQAASMDTLAMPPGFRLGRVVYSDEFSDPSSGWANEPAEQRGRAADEHHGYVDGLYRLEANVARWQLWTCPHGAPPDEFSCDLVGRVYGDKPTSRGLMGLNLGFGPRFLQVKLTVDGSLDLAINRGKDAGEITTIASISHLAIKTGALEFNKLTIRLAKSRLYILVNGIKVCEPVTLPWDDPPLSLAVSISCHSPNLRAEFDRIEIRELISEANTK